MTLLSPVFYLVFFLYRVKHRRIAAFVQNSIYREFVDRLVTATGVCLLAGFHDSRKLRFLNGCIQTSADGRGLCGPSPEEGGAFWGTANRAAAAGWGLFLPTIARGLDNQARVYPVRRYSARFWWSCHLRMRRMLLPRQMTMNMGWLAACGHAIMRNAGAWHGQFGQARSGSIPISNFPFPPHLAVMGQTVSAGKRAGWLARLSAAKICLS